MQKHVTTMNGSSEKAENQLAPSEKIIYIIGPFRVQNELMSLFLEQKLGIRCLTAENVDHVLMHTDAQQLPISLILLDCLGYSPEDLLVAIGKREIFSGKFVALFNLSSGLRIEEEAVMRGVRGFFYTGDPLYRFQKGIRAIIKGELWLSRKIMTRFVLENTCQRIFSTTQSASLTRRESEILNMIAQGTNNTKIANRLYISPHTVKTHLYNIYKKIKVSNRLEAAFWADKNL